MAGGVDSFGGRWIGLKGGWVGLESGRERGGWVGLEGGREKEGWKRGRKKERREVAVCSRIASRGGKGVRRVRMRHPWSTLEGSPIMKLFKEQASGGSKGTT